MPAVMSEITCCEIGAPEKERWSEPVELSPADRPAVEALQAGRILEVRGDRAEMLLAGIDRVGLIPLPSGRRVRIRSKIDGVVLLDWMAYLGECPPAPQWVRGEGPGGGDVPTLLSLQFMAELETLTRNHLRKDYVQSRSEHPTVRGRLLTGAMARAYHRLPLLPQVSRTRTLGSPHNRVLAAALDRLPVLLAGAVQADGDTRPRLAALQEAWAGVDRGLPDPARAVAGSQWACPSGYGPAIQLAAAILQGTSPDLSSSPGFTGQAFLLSVAGLWERGLRRMCHDLRDQTGWSPVPDAQRTKRWDDGPGFADPVRWMTADVLLARGGRRWVLDAKYKRDYGAEHRHDRFQVAAYAMAFGAERGSLVYPTAEGAAGRSRLLLAGDVRGEPVAIDSIELPMAAGPEGCRGALLGLVHDGCGGAQPAGPATAPAVNPTGTGAGRNS